MTREVNRLKPLADKDGPSGMSSGNSSSAGGATDKGALVTGDVKVVTALTDNENHRHVYIYYRRKAQQTLRHIRQQFDAGSLSLDAAKRLHRQVAQDCGLAG